MRRGSLLPRRRVASALLAFAAVVAPGRVAAQARVRDLVVTLGGSVENYSGNFSAVTVPIVDSTDHAVATVGEVGVHGVIALLEGNGRSFEASFDGGMRQAAAVGFRLKDYAPREWAGSVAARLQQRLGSWGSLQLRGAARGRSVRDRPPMPLFLQPGYGVRQGELTLVTRSIDGVSLDAAVDVESADYTPGILAQLDLLDRRSSGVEVGLRWGTASTMRFYSGMRWTEYPNQASGEPSDPFRRDRTVRTGLEWTYAGGVFAQVGLDGTLNRSNSQRPEYDALSARLLLTVPLPAELSVSLFAVLTGKSYVVDPTYQQLVPGEEADNASIAYLQLNRPLAPNLDGAIRFGWTRAETDIGSTYYQRFGGSIQFNYRPMNAGG